MEQNKLIVDIHKISHALKSPFNLYIPINQIVQLTNISQIYQQTPPVNHKPISANALPPRASPIIESLGVETAVLFSVFELVWKTQYQSKKGYLPFLPKAANRPMPHIITITNHVNPNPHHRPRHLKQPTGRLSVHVYYCLSAQWVYVTRFGPGVSCTPRLLKAKHG